MKPETSVMVGLATGALVWSIYANVTPSIADIRVGPQGDSDIGSARKAATITAAGAVSGISLIAKDPTIFILGGAMVIVADWLTRHANHVNPETGRVMRRTGTGNVALQDMASDPVFMSGAGV